MLFNSVEFALFLPLVFSIYWILGSKNRSAQNFFLLLASYLFYGWWDYRFLTLIAFSTLVDFAMGLSIRKAQKEQRKKIYLWISILVNIGFLGFFKYYNFFIESFQDAFTLLGQSFEISTLQIVLPVGISFYTFQTLSYTIDVYRKKLAPTRDLLAFSAFVSFFPQLVAGPIERATNLLPQFQDKRVFDYEKAKDGLRQILWGLFKKIVIADNCAEYANEIFNNSGDYSGSTLFMGAFFFAFQIYGDFSGYSDIAIGTSRLFGFNLMQNFAFPYFSRDIAEFWRRWHISLSTWFRDYVYIPLGGSRGGTQMKIRNTMIIFVVSGFWHGANWTFIIWGFLNACYFLPLQLMERNRRYTNLVAENRLFINATELLQIFITFLLTLLAWIFFRANSVGHAIEYIRDMFVKSLLEVPEIFSWEVILLTLFMIIVEWLGRSNLYALEGLPTLPRWFRWIAYFILLFMLFTFTGRQQEFIYFQF